MAKVLLKGTQTRYAFVPEQATDFIFCTIGEGFGFVGSMVLMGIYFLLLMRIVTIAERQRSVFSRCYAYGVASVFFFHLAVNVCMTIGPCTGCWYFIAIYKLWRNIITNVYHYAFYFSKIGCRQANGVEINIFSMKIIPLSEGAFTIDKKQTLCSV